MKELFFNNKEKRYFLVLTDEDLHCSFCNKVIEFGTHLFIHKSYSKKEYDKCFYCMNCIKHHKKRIYDEFVVVEATNYIPKNSIIVPDSRPSLQSGNINVFDAAISNKGINTDCSNVNVIDHTKLAGKESFDGSFIGKDMKPELELKDQHIGKEEAFCLLDDIKSSKPILPQTRKVIDFLTEREKKDILLT